MTPTVGQTLRPYQVRAKAELRARMAAGSRRIVLVLPTGGGKTTIAADIIRDTLARGREPNRVLFLAHRTELINQCSARLTEFGLTEHGIIKADDGRRRPFAPIQVASVQTLVRRKKALSPAPALIIADECHLSIADGYSGILDTYPRAVVLGLTATPWRLDGRGLGRLYDDMVRGGTYAELLTSTPPSLVPARVFCPWSPELSRVKTTAGDYDLEDLDRQINEEHRIGDVVEWWQKLAGGRRTVAFCTTVKHSKAMTAAFRAAGVAAEHLDGEADEDRRKGVLRRLHAGETRVVTNCAVLCEGWDCPPVEVCILSRPTKSLALFMQCVGRTLRPSPGKVDALVLDHAGAVLTHGWPTLDRDWTLDDRDEREPGDTDTLIKLCPSCFAAMPKAIMVCPQCGHEFKAGEREEKPLDGASGTPMVEVTEAEARLATAEQLPLPHLAVEVRGKPYKPPVVRGARFTRGEFLRAEFDRGTVRR